MKKQTTHFTAKIKAVEAPRKKLQQVVELIRKGKRKEALKSLNILAKKFSKSTTVYYLKGQLHYQLAEYESSIIAYNNYLLTEPSSAEVHNNLGNAYQAQGKFNDAISAYHKALAINQEYAAALNNMGAAFRKQGKLNEALNAYKRAISIDSNYAEAFFNAGNVLKLLGDIESAVMAFKKAYSIRPDYAAVYQNLSVLFQEEVDLIKATEYAKKALKCHPHLAEVYNNLSVIYKKQGKLDEALYVARKALSLKPNYAEAYNNMGNAYQEHNNVPAAIDSYKKALNIKPDYSKALWNLSGTVEALSSAKNYIVQCLDHDPNHLEAKLTLSALKFYEGDTSDYYNFLSSSLKSHPLMRSFAWVFNLDVLPELHFHRWALFDSMIACSNRERPFYEFGVWRGEAFRHLIGSFKRGYGFDTFQGIPEDWHSEKAGTYSSDGNVPVISGGKFIVGKFEDTLPSFFSVPRPVASIVNFDADLYSSTICALNFAKNVIDQDTILIFDEFIINDNWELDEYRALNEFCSSNNISYEVLAVSFFTKQVAVRLKDV